MRILKLVLYIQSIILLLYTGVIKLAEPTLTDMQVLLLLMSDPYFVLALIGVVLTTVFIQVNNGSDK